MTTWMKFAVHIAAVVNTPIIIKGGEPDPYWIRIRHSIVVHDLYGGSQERLDAISWMFYTPELWKELNK